MGDCREPPILVISAGAVLFEFDPITADWDEATGEMVLRIHPQDAKRILRWVRHASEHTGVYAHRLEELD